MAEPKSPKASAKKHPPRQRIDATIGRLTYVPSWAGEGAAEGIGSLQRTRGTAESRPLLSESLNTAKPH